MEVALFREAFHTFAAGSVRTRSQLSFHEKFYPAFIETIQFVDRLNDTLSDSAISMISSLCFNTRASIAKYPPNVEEVDEEKEKRNCKQNTSEAKDQAVFP